MSAFFSLLDQIQDFIWGYIGLVLIIGTGLYFTFTSKFFQLREAPKIAKNFFNLLSQEHSDARGSHPIQVFFAAVGGCIGIGNVVSVCIAVQIGGPGAVFWIWVTSLLGMLLKYSEVYLGLKYRVENREGSYDGGPMYFLRRAFKGKWAATLVCILLCVYGVEVFLFKTVVSSISLNFSLPPVAVMIALLAAILFAGFGGVSRVGKISSCLVPFFVVAYLFFGGWVIFANSALIPDVISSIFSSAFNGHAAIGGFIGSTMAQAISQGLASGCYTGDIGIGYASVIHAETRETNPVRQASLAVMAIFLDTIIVCSITLLVILLTGIWHEPIDPSIMVQQALSRYFPHMDLFMTVLIFLLGYSTIIAYFVVGMKCASFLFKKRLGNWLFSIYACIAFICTMFFEVKQAFTIMLLAGGGLMILNLIGIFLMRKEISFTFPKK